MPVKVRERVRALRPAAVAAAAAAALLWAGCAAEAPETPAAEGRVARAFGAPYDIVTNFTPAEPDVPPTLEGDTLVVRVTYPGGCESHDFALAYDAAADTSALWIEHDAHGDDCEGLLRDELRLPVPGRALEAPVVVLRNPRGGSPFILRWGP